MKWTTYRDGSILIETDESGVNSADVLSISFDSLDALDRFCDALCTARNAAAESIEDGREDEGTC